MKSLSIGVGLVTVIFLAGCTTAGPYVTNISSDGKGGLIVEKTMVEYNGFLGVVTQKNPTTSSIQVIPMQK